MTFLYLGTALFLLLTLIGGLSRIRRGPTPADRMLAAQLMGTTGAAVLLLLGKAAGSPGVIDVALVFVLLALVSVFAFVHQAWSGEGDE